MNNFLRNTIKFTHPDKNIMTIIQNCLNDNIINKKYELFNIIRPIPPNILEDIDIDIWCINNWGCKHDIFWYDKYIIEETDNNNIILTINKFVTKYNPPTKLYKYMIKNGYIIYD